MMRCTVFDSVLEVPGDTNLHVIVPVQAEQHVRTRDVDEYTRFQLNRPALPEAAAGFKVNKRGLRVAVDNGASKHISALRVVESQPHADEHIVIQRGARGIVTPAVVKVCCQHTQIGSTAEHPEKRVFEPYH